jgi:hypothetical protein
MKDTKVNFVLGQAPPVSKAAAVSRRGCAGQRTNLLGPWMLGASLFGYKTAALGSGLGQKPFGETGQIQAPCRDVSGLDSFRLAPSRQYAPR